jgi:hypothetical protein
MKTLKKLTAILPASALLLLAMTKVDYDHAVNFNNYKTYSWLKVEAGNSLWQDRIQRAVDNELAAKGWQRVFQEATRAFQPWVPRVTNSSLRPTLRVWEAAGTGEASATASPPLRLRMCVWGFDGRHFRWARKEAAMARHG